MLIHQSNKLKAHLKSSKDIIELNKDIIKIGRDNCNDIILSHPSISKEHAEILFKEASALIKDLSSRNGTCVNNTRITSLPVALYQGDTITFGKDPIAYVYEVINENNMTMDYPNKAIDEKISLVNDEHYEFSKINHLKSKQGLYINNTYSEYLNPPHTHKPFGNQSNTLPMPQLPRGNQPRMPEPSLIDNRNRDIEKEEIDSQIEKDLIEEKEKVKKLTALFDQLTEEYNVLNAKHNALMIYSSDLQKKLDASEMELKSCKPSRLQQATNDDVIEMSKIIIEKDKVISSLQQEVNYYRNQTREPPNNNNLLMSKLDKLIETLMNENKDKKEEIDRLKAINNDKTTQSQREKEDSLKHYQDQMNSQITQFNDIITDYDNRLVDALEKLASLFKVENDDDNDEEVMSNRNRDKAARYLVEQVNSFMRENQQLLNENAIIKSNLVEMQNEIASLHQQKPDINSNANTSDSSNTKIQALTQKIEELEKLIATVNQEKLTKPQNYSPYRNELQDTEVPLNRQKEEMKEYVFDSLTKLHDKEKEIEKLKGKINETSLREDSIPFNTYKPNSYSNKKDYQSLFDEFQSQRNFITP